MRTIWKDKGSRIWLIVASSLCALILVINLVTTQVGLIFGTVNLALGGYRYKGADSDIKYYESVYESKEESAEAIRKLSEDIMGEGIVLLKNELVSGNEKALPLAENARVSVFGRNSVDMVYGGSGSGGRSTDKVVNFYTALKEVGNIDFNPTLKGLYDNSSIGRVANPGTGGGNYLAGFAVAEVPVADANYSAAITASYEEYNDAAIIVISRIGGEGFDLPRSMSTAFNGPNGTVGLTKVTGARNADDHYLQLDQNETDLIKHVAGRAEFDRIIVLINSGSVMECGFLDDPLHYAYSSKIKAALWIGNPGGQGNNAVAKVLSGKVNPSGHTPDTFARDFKKDPTWNNFANNLVDNGNQYFMQSWGTGLGGSTKGHFVRYEEGIYTGYRYYETRGFTEGDSPVSLTGAKAINGTGTTNWGSWHDAHVVYPFGHGMSYTDFRWELINATPAAGADLTRDGKISVTVRVHNEGAVAGKDAVQLYYTAPYINGGIEKPYVVLGNFEKTGMIKPGEYEDVTVTLNVSDMASYDWNNANGNGHKGYKLDKGSYTIRLSKDAHDTGITVNYNMAADINYLNDTKTNAEVKNRFDDVSNHITGYLSRREVNAGTYAWETTWPVSPVSSTRNNSYNVLKNPSSQETRNFIAPLSSHTSYNAADYDKGQPWEVKTAVPAMNVASDLNLVDMLVKSTDPITAKDTYKASFGDQRWKEIVEQLSFDEMRNLIGIGSFSSAYIQSIGKPATLDYDGPGGWVVGSFMSLSGSSVDVCFFPAQSLIAATWSKELTLKMGEAIGDEGIWGGYQDGMQRTFNGWYAPGVNIHRSQFGGRNFEYYSEDGLLSGKLAAQVVKGAKSNGTYTFIKHFVLNEQETDRSTNGLVTWANEQSMREIYFKPFELAVKEGGTTAMMTSFNRIGMEWTGSSYALLTEVLRNEWGFQGMVITDYNFAGVSYMHLDKMIRAGGDLNLFQSIASSYLSDKSATSVTAMQKACKNILYTTANSNAMDALADARLMPIWVIVMICIDAAIIAGLGVWGFFVIRKAYRKEKAKQ